MPASDLVAAVVPARGVREAASVGQAARAGGRVAEPEPVPAGTARAGSARAGSVREVRATVVRAPVPARAPGRVVSGVRPARVDARAPVA
ncbi:hypothetical protein ACFFMR_29765 [Micromonospora andamanensis]|uniref:hypothetical protein n=1 Tax=Micromonospora andamanensis TaxID=1287068 RepID=UPI00194FE75D|nr:hypothetical protein [Micromonospora andamanensis]